METMPIVRTVSVTMIGGSTALLRYAGLQILTDPTFDLPRPAEGRPVRTQPPACRPSDLGPVDVALVSHDQHPDNLDASGRALLDEVPLVLTTRLGATRLGGSARGLGEYEEVEVPGPIATVRITGVPAQHGPLGAEEHSGPVLGFLLRADGHPSVYVSGDNASVQVAKGIAARVGPVDVALLFAGAASVPHLFEGRPLTLSGVQVVDVAQVLGVRAVVPMHCEGWTHYREGSAAVVAAFAAAGLSGRLHVLQPGKEVAL